MKGIQSSPLYCQRVRFDTISAFKTGAPATKFYAIQKLKRNVTSSGKKTNIQFLAERLEIFLCKPTRLSNVEVRRKPFNMSQDAVAILGVTMSQTQMPSGQPHVPL